MSRQRHTVWTALLLLSAALAGVVAANERISQDAIERGELGLRELRRAGLEMFSTRFTVEHGYGDGPVDLVDTIRPGGRPTLGGNGMLLRINGLDGQSCVECHSIVRADTVPPTFGVGGVGGSVSNAMIMPTSVDPADLDDLDGSAAFDGRFANPPFIFGAGAVELLGLEMTADLHALRQRALAQPGVRVELMSKGVSFGSIVADASGTIDTSAVEGVDEDLVVEPFGRKGEFATAREFDVEAMAFHFGMQPTEVVGHDVDGDGDGMANEVLEGELSALSVFVATMDRPIQKRMGSAARRGAAAFEEIGCAECHRQLTTERTLLPLRFPEVRSDPEANVFVMVDLTRRPTGFRRTAAGGLDVPLFADLKRHDMGPGLAETFRGADARRNREFTTARLWGVADTAPYLHDGRATTLTEAILWHGGEAQAARDAFAGLPDRGRADVLEFLGTLRTPGNPVADLLEGDADGDSGDD